MSLFTRFRKKFAEISEAFSKKGLDLGQPAAAPTSNLSSLRDALFADATLDELEKGLTAEAQTSGPFAVFAKAAEARRSGHTNEAAELLRTLTDGQESRVELLAWAALREIGVLPDPESAKKVLGVVVEVAMKGGEDLVAAYPEHTARYYNYSGASVVWETNDPRLNPQIDNLIEAGRKLVTVIGPWEQRRPDIPKADQVRLNILTPSGLHFGEGPMSAFSRDPMGGPVIRAALELMQALIAVGAEFRNDEQNRN